MTFEICGADEDLENYPEEENQPARDYIPDHKPEYFQYKDEGCKRARSCLDCPFPCCFYDTTAGRKALLKEIRNEEIQRLYQSGSTRRRLSKRFRLSERTIERIINQNPGAADMNETLKENGTDE